jgi:hypothetical protein
MCWTTFSRLPELGQPGKKALQVRVRVGLLAVCGGESRQIGLRIAKLLEELDGIEISSDVPQILLDLFAHLGVREEPIAGRLRRQKPAGHFGAIAGLVTELSSGWMAWVEASKLIWAKGFAW